MKNFLTLMTLLVVTNIIFTTNAQAQPERSTDFIKSMTMTPAAGDDYYERYQVCVTAQNLPATGTLEIGANDQVQYTNGIAAGETQCAIISILRPECSPENRSVFAAIMDNNGRMQKNSCIITIGGRCGKENDGE